MLDIALPPVFSFIDNPDQSVRALVALATQIQHANVREARIHQQNCKGIDFGAATTLNIIAKEAVKCLRKGFSGFVPNDDSLSEIVWATGLPHTFGISDPNPSRFITFRTRHGKLQEANALTSSTPEAVGTELTIYINDCFNRYNFELTEKGTEALASLLGEVLDNAAHHSGFGHWWASAYLMRPGDTQTGLVNLCIISLGDSYAQSLASLPKSALLRSSIEHLADHHARRRAFLPSRWTRENLWTLYALQEKVSRHNGGAALIGTRGTGTAEMIETFQMLGQSVDDGVETGMAIISGSTFISFSPRYKMRRQDTGSGTAHRIIAFNEQNDLKIPPDHKCVRPLKHHFPGTAISLRFFVDPRHLASTTNGNHRT